MNYREKIKSAMDLLVDVENTEQLIKIMQRFDNDSHFQLCFKTKPTIIFTEDLQNQFKTQMISRFEKINEDRIIEINRILNLNTSICSDNDNINDNNVYL